MTYNVHKESRHLDPMIAVIRQIGADVVAFQELSRQAADCFAAALADEYPYRALHAFPDRWRGQGILSRYPITADEYWWNAHVPGSMGHQRVELDVRGMKVTVYNTHPVHPGMEGSRPRFDTLPRHEEIRILVARAAADEGPVILAGDFNLPDQAEDYRYITSHFVDAFREVGWGMGFTFPDFGYPQAAEEFNLPPLATPLFLRLDYIFHNEAARAIEARVWPDSGGADHRPVVVKLGLLRGPVG
jgi:endonuclease/exonuclease/phosphatase (EEP) superfamily protein YafD